MKKCEENGYFIVSLDFELLWGVRDHETKESFKNQVFGARQAIGDMLRMFEKYKIHATWGVVGFLMAENKNEILRFSPEKKPSYSNTIRSMYQYFDDVGEDEANDKYYFANSLVSEILKYENQELASHTFSHYYCKEDGQTINDFANDLISAKNIAKEKFGVDITSIIFPRNQVQDEYIEKAYELGFKAYRGNPNGFLYNSNNIFSRCFRLIDTYINIFGNKGFKKEHCDKHKIANIRASMFYRKYNPKLKFLEKLKIKNIKRQMKKAAKKKEIFHLWWHPHNIGVYTDKCLAQLEEIFIYRQYLEDKYNFKSVNMIELGGQIDEKNSVDV